MTDPITKREHPPERAATCVATRSEKFVRGVAAVFVAGFALSSLDTPWLAGLAGIGSVLLMVGAITGRCPT